MFITPELTEISTKLGSFLWDWNCFCKAWGPEMEAWQRIKIRTSNGSPAEHHHSSDWGPEAGAAGRKWSQENLTQRLSLGGWVAQGAETARSPCLPRAEVSTVGADEYRPACISCWPGVGGHWLFLSPRAWLKSTPMHLASWKYKLFSAASNFKGIHGMKWVGRVSVDFTCILYTSKFFKIYIYVYIHIYAKSFRRNAQFLNRLKGCRIKDEFLKVGMLIKKILTR